jgi:hypothetical protein
MKTAKFAILLLLISSASIYYFGCDDSGTVPTEVRAGTITFTQVSQFPTMNTANDGLYNLWLIVTDTNGTPRPLNLGRFNVASNGTLVDASGNPLDLAMNLHDTIDLPRALYAIVTIEQGVVGQPGLSRLIAGPVVIYPDSVSAHLIFTDTVAFGTKGISILAPNSVFYHINTPTGPAGDCQKGIWFADEGGVASWPSNSALTQGLGWKYRGWLRNKVNGETLDLGVFYRADQPDLDGAGPCSGTTGQPYNTPGQDFINPGCSVNPINNIFDGTYEVFATLEPEFRGNNLPPFVFKLFYQGNIVSSLGCNRRDNMFTQRQNIPDVRMKITR